LSWPEQHFLSFSIYSLRLQTTKVLIT
jgi:hypothetical protein